MLGWVRDRKSALHAQRVCLVHHRLPDSTTNEPNYTAVLQCCCSVYKTRWLQWTSAGWVRNKKGHTPVTGASPVFLVRSQDVHLSPQSRLCKLSTRTDPVLTGIYTPFLAQQQQQQPVVPYPLCLSSALASSVSRGRRLGAGRAECPGDTG